MAYLALVIGDPAGPAMPLEPAIRRARRILICSVLILSCVPAAEVMSRRLYEITTETAMPHLEENLRYATTRERRCLNQEELRIAFPILHHAALKGCELEQESHQEDDISYALVCEAGDGTTGRATWQLGRSEIKGTLYVKLGGKNMTFYQRITAKPLAECAAG